MLKFIIGSGRDKSAPREGGRQMLRFAQHDSAVPGDKSAPTGFPAMSECTTKFATTGYFLP